VLLNGEVGGGGEGVQVEEDTPTLHNTSRLQLHTTTHCCLRWGWAGLGGCWEVMSDVVPTFKHLLIP